MQELNCDYAAYIGTSGYSYKSWDKAFYGDIPRQHQLEYYATQFPTVEINATCYKHHEVRSNLILHACKMKLKSSARIAASPLRS